MLCPGEKGKLVINSNPPIHLEIDGGFSVTTDGDEVSTTIDHPMTADINWTFSKDIEDVLLDPPGQQYQYHTHPYYTACPTTQFNALGFERLKIEGKRVRAKFDANNNEGNAGNCSYRVIFASNCTIKVTSASGGTIFERTFAGSCPTWDVACGENDCPPGTCKCPTNSYPGYCCLPCKQVRDRINNLAGRVRCE